MAQAQRRKRLRVQSGTSDPEEKIQVLGVFMTVLALGLVIVLAIVHTHVRYNDVRYQQRSLERERAKLENEHNALLTRVQALSNPERITRKAAEMGMVLPPDQKVVLLFVRNPIVEADRAALAAAPKARTLMDRVLAMLGREERPTAVATNQS